MTATPAAPARMQSAAFDASIPPIATTGTDTARQTSARPSRPIGSDASGFDGVAHTRSSADVGRAGELGDGGLAARPGGDAQRDPGRGRALGPGVALAEVDAAAQLERCVDVVVDDQLRVERRELTSQGDDLRRRCPLQPQLDDGRSGPGRRSGGLGVRDERVEPHRRESVVPTQSSASQKRLAQAEAAPKGACVGTTQALIPRSPWRGRRGSRDRGRRGRRRDRRGSCPGPWRPPPRPRRRRRSRRAPPRRPPARRRSQRGNSP